MSLPQNFLDAMPAVQARANSSSDKRHLVSVYCNGGMDHLNTVYPTDAGGYADLLAMRGDMAQPQNGGVPLTGQNASMHPGLAELAAKHNAGKLAIIGNVGVLARPLTKATIQDGSAIRPLVLQSHADQEREWKTARPLSTAGDMGWLGLAMDLIGPAYNGEDAYPATISVDIGSALMNGNVPAQYTLGSDGAAQMTASIDNSRISFLRAFAEGTSGNFLLQKEVSRRVARGNSLGAYFNQQLAAIDVAGFPNTGLGRALKMAARLIVLRDVLGHRRSVFNIQMGGWDTHNNLIPYHIANLPTFSQAINAFHEATKVMGPAGSSMENEIVLFTGTDFGRCGTPNSQGTDHGWGGNNFVIGGPVIGGSIYRKEDCASTEVTKNSYYNVALGGKNDYGQGTSIPTTSMHEVCATLLAWFGLPYGAPMACVLPDLSYFSIPNLGFLQGDGNPADDNANRADGAIGTATGGAVYTKMHASGEQMQIAGNKIGQGAVANLQGSVAETGLANRVMTMDIVTPAGTVKPIAIVPRYRDENNWIGLRYTNYNGGWNLFAIVDGVQNDVGGAAYSVDPSDSPQSLEIAMDGPNYVIKLNGELLIETSTAAIADGTKAGVFLYTDYVGQCFDTVDNITHRAL